MSEGVSVVDLKPAWCSECGTRHQSEESCPGEIRPTGPERPTWRAVYKTPHGGEVYRVLISACGESWCARIIMEPNIVWTIPGGTASMRFIGTTAKQAEQLAIGFIEDLCQRMGHRRIEDLPAGVSFAARVEAPRPSGFQARLSRKSRSIRARWGVSKPTSDGETRNLSADGLFIKTSSPPEPGTTVRVSLDLDARKVPLKGRVVWTRERPESNLPPGMGVHLIRPPALYVGYVAAIP